MASVDEFKPSTTEPVFGSGLIQTKVPQHVNNETTTNESEKATSTAEPVVNGQSETKHDDVPVAESSTAHVNGEQERPAVDVPSAVEPDVKPADEPTPAVAESTEKPGEVEPATVSEPDAVTAVEEPVAATTDAQPSETPARKGRVRNMFFTLQMDHFALLGCAWPSENSSGS